MLSGVVVDRPVSMQSCLGKTRAVAQSFASQQHGRTILATPLRAKDCVLSQLEKSPLLVS